LSSLPFPDQAERFMLRAVELALRGKGCTAPNPCVGALLTMNDQIVGEGYHHGPGLPHAEVAAIIDARASRIDTTKCTLWVTLEPCNHQGRTPPCTRAILETGIPRVVVGAADPNPHVSGGGASFLRDRGVDVHLGVAETACKDLIADFTTWVHTSRPYVYLKLAMTLDGRIATRTGDSQWISGESSRRMVHGLRGRVGAVLVGAKTFGQDNPRLTCRLESGAKSGRSQPLAVVVGTSLPPADGDLFLLRRRPRETVFWTTAAAAASPNADALRDLGCRVWGMGEARVDLPAAMSRLRGELGVYDLLCEGGGRLAGHLAECGLVGEWWLFQAPKTLGDEQAVPVLSGSAVERMDQARQWRFAEVRRAGEDVLLILRPVDDLSEATCSPA
jgi:diaminohydroxyphosphoribosylaminopyrimidine deaminase / 5-amino-6-(5-phosphoribosylamino)uracil reductase